MKPAVVLDIGETIKNDDWEFRTWADWLGVSGHTFSAVMGGLQASGRSESVFEILSPGIDVTAERQRRRAAGCGERFVEEDLYPDVRSTLAELRARGYWVAVAGNQSAEMAQAVRELDLPVDAVATSGEWGVAKPTPGFFMHVARLASLPPQQIVYVGDQVTNDVVAATQVGLNAVHIVRGPWGYLSRDDQRVKDLAIASISSLQELPELLVQSHSTRFMGSDHV
jgi:HAD superfamily hydrolase (TIGR01662 family)